MKLTWNNPQQTTVNPLNKPLKLFRGKWYSSSKPQNDLEEGDTLVVKIKQKIPENPNKNIYTT